ncbi:ethanolamine permease [Leptolyngbya sp. FACHB-321]|uniref:ethanolamine permease n=1 Tax=Leptolyngbya sp. FACHB-321 TaxID=2692807 RepID=UPI00168395B4|nr:ethanolamine permease [Leptolyngbya sp. FACHB-321]MBD2035964.1 ethanolamine permease [Leptolyngbya sp. FACHB-321]
MAKNRNRGGVSYEDVDDAYLERRQLRRSAGWILLWALGVGAVISGEFSGWNLGLAAGGFWGLAIATVLMAIMYVCMVFSIAEMSSALPHAGGSYSFTRNAFGPFGGFLNGITDACEFVLTPAVIVYFIGSYLNTLEPLKGVPIPVWWVLFYVVFVGINIIGVELTLKFGLFITVMAASVLVIFYLGAIGKFDPALLTNIAPDPGQTAFLPKGFGGIFAALPYAIWFFLGIEQLPLAAEEAHDSGRDVPKALTWGIFTLLILAFLVLVLNSGVASGADGIGKSGAPLADGLQAVFGAGIFTSTLIVIAISGLIASFHTIIYGYGRVLFSLSRAGYLPRWLSLTGKYHTPALALILGGVIGLACAAAIQFAGKAVGAALLNMAVFAAVISYFLNMISYIQLKISRPDLPRPYQSPLGIPGAIIGAGLSLIALVACFADPGYRPGVWGVAIFLGAMILYFFLYSRRKLVSRAPEEENALLSYALQEIDQPDGLPR